MRTTVAGYRKREVFGLHYDIYESFLCVCVRACVCEGGGGGGGGVDLNQFPRSVIPSFFCFYIATKSIFDTCRCCLILSRMNVF